MDTAMRFKGKVVVITGAGRGIGLSTAHKFVAEGASVVVGEIDEELGRRAVEQLEADGGEAAFVACNVSRPDQAAKLIGDTVATFGRLDICVNNAGTNLGGDVLTVTEADFDSVIGVNVKGPFFVAQAAAKEMVRAGTKGSIVNISSVVSVVAVADQPVYSISKSAINGFTRMLAMTLAEDGIRVNAVGPGTIMTDMSDGVMNLSGDPDSYNRMLSRTPLGRLGQPDEVAEVVLFLASDAASYMTGQVVYPDGGRLSLNHVMPMTWDPVATPDES
jgi:glucose 1-dehydrogenase